MTARKRIAIILVFLVPIAIYLVAAICRCLVTRMVRDMFYSPPVIFKTFEPNEEMYSDYYFREILGWTTHGDRLPNESRNIFACNDRNRDPALWLTFELPKDKIPSFIEKITEIKFEELANGIYSKHSHINEGPRNWKDGFLGEPYWDLDTVENGRHFEEDFFYCGVDTERGKIFLCRWTM